MGYGRLNLFWDCASDDCQYELERANGETLYLNGSISGTFTLYKVNGEKAEIDSADYDVSLDFCEDSNGNCFSPEEKGITSLERAYFNEYMQEVLYTMALDTDDSEVDEYEDYENYEDD